MLSNGDNWCLVATYKENYSLLSGLVSYYRRYYGIRNFLLLCSLPESRSPAALKQLVADKTGAQVVADRTKVTPGNRELAVTEFSGPGFRLWTASSPAVKFIAETDFHDLKTDLYRWADAFLPAEITRVIVQDNDEFLYVKDPRSLEQQDGLGFHFVDVVPSAVWPPEELRFSLQGWYYRRQARPLFKLGGRLAVALARRLGRGIDHSGCKTFYFARAGLKDHTVWHHGTDRNRCACQVVDRHAGAPERCGELLRDTALCYHLAMTSKDLFLAERFHLFNRIQTDWHPPSAPAPRPDGESDRRDRAAKDFDRFMKESKFPVFRDNFLLTYLREDR
jgi:hypothetical protein